MRGKRSRKDLPFYRRSRGWNPIRKTRPTIHDRMHFWRVCAGPWADDESAAGYLGIFPEERQHVFAAKAPASMTTAGRREEIKY